MTMTTNVTVIQDDRLRLMSSALAATGFPEQAQARKKHQPHAHARHLHKFMMDNQLNQHPAIQNLQTMLDNDTPLEALYTLIMHCEWDGLEIPALPRWVPDNWNKELWNFYVECDLEAQWDTDADAYIHAYEESQRAFAKVQFVEFLKPFFGDFSEDFAFMPNLCYPADREVGIRIGNRLIAIVPPTLAWGESPPWPYDEESMYPQVYRAALTQYGRLLMNAYLRAHADDVEEASKKELAVSDQFKSLHPTWEDQFTSLFVAAAVAMYLEDYMNRAEARAYILMEKKTRGLAILPGTISVLRRYLQEKGNRYDSLAEFLSVFPVQLRVAKKIASF